MHNLLRAAFRGLAPLPIFRNHPRIELRPVGSSSILRGFTLLLLISGFVRAQTAISAGISGKVIGDDNQPLQATVWANGFGTAGSTKTSSAADGSFSISGLAPGNYVLCGRVAGGAYLDPCAWSSQIVTNGNSSAISVSSGKVTSGVQLVMTKGAPVSIRVNVPPNVLGVPLGAGQPIPHLVIALITPHGLMEPVSVVSQDATGINQQATIPPNVPTRVAVIGQGLKVTDSNAKNVNTNGVWGTVTSTGSGSAPTLTFNVALP